MSEDLPPTKARIVHAAARLFAQRGYHAVGMTELQDAVQLKRGALYHYIRSKEDLLYEISRQYIAELLEAGQRLMRDVSAPSDRLRCLGRDLVLKIVSHQSELIVCFQEVHALTSERHAEVMDIHAHYERLWRETFRQGAAEGQFRPFDAVVLKGLLGMYFYSYLWIKADGARSADEIAETLNELAARMLHKEPDFDLASTDRQVRAVAARRRKSPN